MHVPPQRDVRGREDRRDSPTDIERIEPSEIRRTSDRKMPPCRYRWLGAPVRQRKDDVKRSREMRPRRVAIVGSGVVGTATGAGFAAKGHEVVFCDVSVDRVTTLRRRGFHAVEAGDLPGVRPDAYLLSVPTPTNDGGRTDLSFVAEAVRSIGNALHEHPGWPVVVVRSTVPPGTTEDVVLPSLEAASGRKAGTDFGLCVNPEFLRAASAPEDFLHPHVIVIGAFDQRSLNLLRAL